MTQSQVLPFAGSKRTLCSIGHQHFLSSLLSLSPGGRRFLCAHLKHGARQARKSDINHRSNVRGTQQPTKSFSLFLFSRAELGHFGQFGGKLSRLLSFSTTATMFGLCRQHPPLFAPITRRTALISIIIDARSADADAGEVKVKMLTGCRQASELWSSRD